ncbi:hypothetical protein HanPSC8_Chr16g0711261 [Helianthus annuus]|nr:hypothetical protein HanPSC8_Chr16g0711261 [Helianthus annuus]
MNKIQYLFMHSTSKCSINVEASIQQNLLTPFSCLSILLAISPYDFSSILYFL